MSSLDPPLLPAPSPEPAYCPGCELRHTRRPDWLCPRCGSPVSTDLPPPRAAPVPRPGPRFPLGSRLAGAILLATAGAVAGAATGRFAALPAGALRWRLLVVVAALAGLGLGLLLRRSLARWSAAFLAVVAVVLLSDALLRVVSPGLLRDPLPAPVRQVLRDLIRDHDPRTLLLLLAFAIGGLLLVAGRPRRRRVVAGVLLAAPLLVRAFVAALMR